jgi:hypothetical protein
MVSIARGKVEFIEPMLVLAVKKLLKGIGLRIRTEVSEVVAD